MPWLTSRTWPVTHPACVIKSKASEIYSSGSFGCSGIDQLLDRLPRRCRGRWKEITVLILPNELGVFQTFSQVSANSFAESPRVIVFALVKPKGLFVQV